jgi:type VI secretion system protein ImpL
MNPQPDIPAVGIWLIVIAIAILIVAVVIVWTLRRARKGPDKSDAMAEAALTVSRLARASSMVPSFARGLRFLRGHVTGRNHLYDIPWLMMLGPAGSGTSTVLGNAAASASLSREGGRNFGLPGGLEWWFFEPGLVLNPPSDIVLRHDGTSDRTNWQALLQLLSRKRPRRPLDAIILAISAEELLEGPNAPSPADLTARADVLRRKLSQLRRAASMRMPVYVLITKCDLIPGFGSFAGELPKELHSNIFGWSNPYPLEEAFSPAWVDQCCDSMRRRIIEQQMEIFVERDQLREPDGVFLFPTQFHSLRIPLRQYLGQIFQETAYEESYYFRGIYFCGDAIAVTVASEPQPVMAAAAASAGAGTTHVEELPSSETTLIRTRTPLSILSMSDRDETPRPVFLNDLFERKIFPECRLARPLSVIDMSRNRVVLVAKVLTILFILIAGTGTLSAYMRFASLKRDHLAALFDQLATDLARSNFIRAEHGVETTEEHNFRTLQASMDSNVVLHSMGRLSATRMRSVFMPDSWNEVVDHDFQDALAAAFSTIVLNGFRVEFGLRLKDLIEATTPSRRAPEDSADEAVGGPGITDPIYETPTLVPQYRGWGQFVTGLRELESNVGRYNRIATPGGGSATDLKELLKYLKLDTDLPPDFDFNNPYFVGMLLHASNQRFEFQSRDPAVIDRDDAVEHARSLVQGFFETWFGPKNHLAEAVDKMAIDISTFPQNGAGVSYQGLKNIADSIQHVSSDLDSPAFDWISDGDFDLQRYPAFNQPVTDLQFLQGFSLKDEVARYGQDGHRKFMRALSQKSTPLTGQVLDMDAVPIQVSGSVAALRANLRVLLDQVFVAREPAPQKVLDSSLMMWDRNSLLEADRLIDAYDKFEKGSLRTAPPYIRGALQRAALGRLQDNVFDYIGQAQSAIPAGAPDGADLQSFSQSLEVLQRLLAGSGKFPKSTASANLNSLLVTQASNLLITADQQLKDKHLYDVRDRSFDWWEGEKPLSLAAYDVRSTDDLKDYLDHQMERLTTMAQQADPLVRFLQARHSASGQEATAAFNDWRLILLEMKRHTEKAPGNSVALLEDFIRTGMDKIAPDTSCQDATRDPVGRSDYFLSFRSELRKDAVARCTILSRRAYTTQIAEFFNQRLGGKFPFLITAPQNQLTEADPKALVGFYAKLDQYGKIATESLRNPNQDPQNAKVRDTALEFLARMTQIRPVFATFLAGFEKDPSPSFDFVVNFRTNRGREIEANQIGDWSLDSGSQSFRYRTKENTGRWRLGDPVRVTFRFADDSPLIPVPDASQPEMTVHQRTVSFDYGGAWSLFRLLLAHKPQMAEFEKESDPAPHTLSFLIPTMPDRTLPQRKDSPGAGQVRVYLQITVVPMGGKDGVNVPLPFPVAAPSVNER